MNIRNPLTAEQGDAMTGIDPLCNDIHDEDGIRSLVHQFLFVFRSDVCRHADMAYFCTLPTVSETPHAQPGKLMDYLVDHCGWIEVTGWGRIFRRRTIRRP